MSKSTGLTCTKHAAAINAQNTRVTVVRHEKAMTICCINAGLPAEALDELYGVEDSHLMHASLLDEQGPGSEVQRSPAPTQVNNGLSEGMVA